MPSFFVKDDVFNRRNSIFIVIDSSCEPPIMQSKHGAYVLVFGAVTTDWESHAPSLHSSRDADIYGRIYEYSGNGVTFLKR